MEVEMSRYVCWSRGKKCERREEEGEERKGYRYVFVISFACMRVCIYSITSLYVCGCGCVYV